MSLVLVVDDDPISIDLLTLILNRAGHEVVESRDAVTGMILIDVREPDLIIIDDMMPDITGGEMCRRLKANPRLKHIPIILISAGMRLQDPRYVQTVGADSVLLKPIVTKDVLDAVARTLPS